MIELLVLMVAGLLLIALCAVIGPRIGVASPLLLVLAGVAASFLPIFTDVGIEPELILAGLLPPLLYSAASSMPAMNFRREFGTISGLSVLLVVGTALVLGAFFQLVIPDLGFAWGVALGAIISPTDAVATSIVKQNPASKRVAAILDGEGLLNDATALVVLRTAIVATAASFSFWSAVGSFAFSVVVATLIGLIAGIVNLAVRRRIDDPTASAAISLSIPFLASIPAEALGASGLVAAVVAGLLTDIRAPRDLSPHIRLPDAQNWRTVELVLEGIIFLTMGLQIRTIMLDVHEEHGGLGTAVLIAVGALALTVLIRAAFVAPLLVLLKRKRQRLQRMQPRLSDLQETLSTEEGRQQTSQRFTRPRGREISERQMDRFVTRVTRGRLISTTS